MYCFTRFVNNTSSPVITVLVDDSRIFSDILQGSVTSYASLCIGTRELAVLQNNSRPYLKASISLPPANRCTIVIEDEIINISSD